MRGLQFIEVSFFHLDLGADGAKQQAHRLKLLKCLTLRRHQLAKRSDLQGLLCCTDSFF